MMTPQARQNATRRIEQILRIVGSSLANEVAKVQDVKQLPRHIRDGIVDQLGEEFSANGLQPDGEPNAYGLEIEHLTDACSLASFEDD